MCCVPIAAFLLVMATGHPDTLAQINPELVTKSLERGISYLKDQQDPNGNWSENQSNPGGITALCTLALIHSGVPNEDPAMKKALAYLRSFSVDDIGTTYATSLHLMVMAAADPRGERVRIANYAKWLVDAQNSRSGGWSYHTRIPTDDPSNSQFALMALHEAEQVGIAIDKATFQAALDYWLKRQDKEGGWRYQSELGATLSMTCAGISSLVIKVFFFSAQKSCFPGNSFSSRSSA